MIFCDGRCFIVDSSEFDNTKAGTYKIYVAPTVVQKAREYFTVTVVEVLTDVLYGDANCDNKVTVADAVAILQHLANKDKNGLSAKGIKNADCNEVGDGVTAKDALAIQQYDAQQITGLPV
ncbi:MAG: dockerin type I repeat-containing protein [Ruminococcus sp.]|nr:dockerin type I repeat-containing protein [Ruminococcus sp.]MBP5363004.1 dockerin type I repeat-containing protein [Ruminococcus sp.]